MLHGADYVCYGVPMSKSKRPQKPKTVRNEDYMRGMQDLRKSNAAQPHRNKSKYNRRDTSWKKDIA